LCADLGHEVEEAAPAINGDMMVKSFMALWAAGLTWTVNSLSYAVGRMPAEGELEAGTLALYEMGKAVSAPDYLISVQYLQILARQVAEFMSGYDLLLTPTLGMPPVPLGSFAPTPEDAMAGMRVATEFVPFTPICNATGQPAMSVPLYWNDTGLPVGTHFVGRFGDEATLFRLAAQLEAARPWAHRRPPVCA
jgi:amidase